MQFFFPFFGYLTQFDLKAKFVSAAAHAHSTLHTRRSYWRTYVRFCAKYNLVPIPAEPKTIIRFLVHLSTYCKYSTIINYLSGINVLHRHFGHNVTFQDIFSIKRLIRGLRRILGDAQEQKLPITPEILTRMLSLQHLLTQDSGLRCCSGSTRPFVNQISCRNRGRTLTLTRPCLAEIL